MGPLADRCIEMAQTAYPSDSGSGTGSGATRSPAAPASRQKQTTVLIADDHPIYRQGLARSIKARPDLKLVSVAEQGREVLAQIEEFDPDVAVVDLRMPELNGLEVARAAGERGARTRMILLTGHGADVAFEALELGIAAVLSKTANPDAICDAIVAVGDGEAYVGPEFHASLAAAISARRDESGPILSPREHEVLELAADGLSVSEIGKRLHLSGATVKTHLQHTYRKLEVTDRAAAVAVALRRGLIS